MTTMPRPGCFGSPTCHNPGQAPCTQCPFQATCAQVSKRVAIGLRRKYGIEPLLSKRGRADARQANAPKPNPTHVTRIAPGDMAVKAKEQLARMAARGIDLRRAVAMRANPFESAPPAFMRVALDRLFAGSFTRDELRAHLTHELGWGDGTALSHVGIVVALLLATGAARDDDGRITAIAKEGT